MIPLEVSFLEPLGRVVGTPWADAVTGLQVDSRRIEEGDLFVAVGDGADFVSTRARTGAAAALIPENAVEALGAIAGEVRARSSARVVAVTGSTGKTSTKDILYALCAPHRRTIANEGNYNTEIGVPLTLCRIETDTEVCIAELAMRGLGQIAWLASFTKPDIVIVTNVGPVHLELVGTIENVAQAKAEAIDALPPGGIAIVPEEPLLEPYLTRSDIVVKRVSATSPLPFKTTYTAAHQLLNTRLAWAAAESLGVPAPTGAALGRVLEAARGGAAAAGRRTAAERLLQREPDVDARCAPAPQRARGRAGGALPSSARWPSSARTPAPTTPRCVTSCGSLASSM